MSLLRQLLDNVKRFRADQENFYMEARKENAYTNLHLLTIASVFSAVLIPILMLIAPLIKKGWRPTTVYYLMFAAMLVFVALSLAYRRRKYCSEAAVETLCVLYCIAVAGFVIGIDVFAYPGQGSSFMPVIIVVLPVVFVLRFSIIGPLILAMEIVYSILTMEFKDSSVASSDLFASIVALLFSFVVSGVVVELRVRDFEAKTKYRDMSMTDMLTGILNKSACESRISRYLTVKDPTVRCVLMVIDIDNFKSINDRFGHRTGDDVLEQMGSSLLSSFRSSDIIGRIGGDEFVAFMHNISVTMDIRDKCREMRTNFSALLHTDANVTFSVGASILESGKTTYERLFRQADGALYEAKNTGKNKNVIRKFQLAEEKSC